MAVRLTEKEDIRRLGFNLNLEPETIRTIFTNHPHSVTTVAEELLHIWYNRQDSLKNVHENLGKALIDSNLNLIAIEALDYKPTAKGQMEENRKSLSTKEKEIMKEINETFNEKPAKEHTELKPSTTYEAHEVESAKTESGTRKTDELGNEAKAVVKSPKRKDSTKEKNIKGTTAAIEGKRAKSEDNPKTGYEPRVAAEIKDKVKSPKETTENGNTKKISETAVEAKIEGKAGKRKRRRRKTHEEGADGKVELEVANGKGSEDKTGMMGSEISKN